MTVMPAGTVTVKSKLALSRGLSLTGYQAGEPCGSPTTNAPSSVGTQPSIDWSGSVTICGCPAYATSMVKVEPLLTPCAGVMISSCPSRTNEARRPSTVTLGMSNPRRSKSKRERSCAACAVITATPSRRRVAGSYDSVSA
jgi:hypothetical protein